MEKAKIIITINLIILVILMSLMFFQVCQQGEAGTMNWVLQLGQCWWLKR